MREPDLLTRAQQRLPPEGERCSLTENFPELHGPYRANNQQNAKKSEAKNTPSDTTISRILPLDGLRVISALVVAFHHIQSVDYSLSDLKAPSDATAFLQDGEKPFVAPSGMFLWLLASNPGVYCFLIISGAVLSYPAWQGKTKSVDHYDRVLFKRYFRLALPLVPAHVVHLLLWHYGLAKGSWGVAPSALSVERGFDKGLLGVFCSHLNGALWILEVFFWAPFVALPVQLVALKVNALGRALWYTACLLFFAGNFHQSSTVSFNLCIVVGVAVSDLWSHRQIVEREHKKTLTCVLWAAALCVPLPWLPSPLYRDSLSQMVCSCACVLLVLFVTPFRQIMEAKPLVALAPYSFALYVWHLPILHTFGTSVTPHFQGGARVAVYGLAYVVCFLVAFCVHWTIEQRCRQLTDCLTEAFFSLSRQSAEEEEEQNSSGEVISKKEQKGAESENSIGKEEEKCDIESRGERTRLLCADEERKREGESHERWGYRSEDSYGSADTEEGKEGSSPASSPRHSLLSSLYYSFSPQTSHRDAAY
uniref:Acyltransferase 3 domain-containing protein n=1 Tax=Chromera velia CCMP2878 TaxID=1169474 RepID=A0A0G4HMI5_9ALVE|eukprot:Cvel_7500.t1-p1 / transcript=Cvel_7500.t1 / gene=Cvel_7500 / organism=Chromera_velia_CCMP2878 / gene_product=hypothetical protein / transcript_product=hypothetical protein / location=Cvel_scaffold393:87577-89178(-) / protein_length=534 / sequence_SO=supercontig / SO=protein_coding / is_pseudo=false